MSLRMNLKEAIYLNPIDVRINLELSKCSVTKNDINDRVFQFFLRNHTLSRSWIFNDSKPFTPPPPSTDWDCPFSMKLLTFTLSTQIENALPKGKTLLSRKGWERKSEKLCKWRKSSAYQPVGCKSVSIGLVDMWLLSYLRDYQNESEFRLPLLFYSKGRCYTCIHCELLRNNHYRWGEQCDGKWEEDGGCSWIQSKSQWSMSIYTKNRSLSADKWLTFLLAQTNSVPFMQ